MTIRILGFAIVIAISVAVGSANAEDGNQWTGFYGGVNGGLAQSNDAKDTRAFDSKNSSTSSSKDAASRGEFSNGQGGYGTGRDYFAKDLEGELDKALSFEKPK